ncbi:hypothetical protein JMG10_32575 [Nostoc ellipsosporum NOK]|nr:hypothetical protein [Nostoc ellipsosporum NOK]
MEQELYYIVITRKNQVLLSFLKIRVVIDKRQIWTMSDCNPVVITLAKNDLQLLATDGFHFSRPLTLHYPREGTYFRLKIVCAIDDRSLLAGSLILATSYLLGFYTGFLLLKIISFLPLIYFLLLYYVNRHDFIQVKQDKPKAGLLKK